MSADHIAAEGAQSCPTYEWGSLLLRPAVSMVSIGPGCHHDHPTRDPCALASRRFPPVLALEVPLPWRSAAGRSGPACTDPSDERCQSALELAAPPLRAPPPRLF